MRALAWRYVRSVKEAREVEVDERAGLGELDAPGGRGRNAVMSCEEASFDRKPMVAA